jgi:hypothetical protein
MTRPHEEPEERDGTDARASWEPPTLTPAGKVRDLVHGGSKVSGNTDSDAGTVRKTAGL